MRVAIAPSSDPELRAGAALCPVSAANRPTSSGQRTRLRPSRRRCEAKSSAPRCTIGRPGPRSRRSARANILSWKVRRLCIHARSSFGCMAKTRTWRASALPGIATASADSASAAVARRLSLLVDLPRKLEVALGDPALRVRGERYRDLAPRDREVRVVVHLLGGRRDAVHEVDRALEVAVVKLLAQGVAVPLPALGRTEPLLDFVVAQNCHGSPLVRIASLVP